MTDNEHKGLLPDTREFMDLLVDKLIAGIQNEDVNLLMLDAVELRDRLDAVTEDK